MIIKCSNEEEFFDTIYALAKRGLTFVADARTWIVTLTGGY